MGAAQPLRAEIKTLEGTKVYHFNALKRLQAIEVFHKSVSVIIEAISSIGIFKDMDDLDPSSLGKAIKVLDFDLVWDLTTKVCDLVIIDGTGITDLEEYFGERPEEMYLALFHGIKLNYPKLFGQMLKRLGDSGLMSKLDQATTSSEE